MRIYNSYILSLAIVAGATNVFLAVLKQQDISVYFVVNIIAYLTVTLLYTYFNPRAKAALNTIGIVLFAGFAVIVALKTVEIISGR